MKSNNDNNNNPLLNLKSYTIKYVLVAFSNTEDAANTPIGKDIGRSGTVITGSSTKEKAVVVINELNDDRFYIISHTNEFSYNMRPDMNTSIMTGSLSVIDRVSGYFQNFLSTQVVKKLGISQTHIIFCLKMFISGVNYDDSREQIIIKPLIFHLLNITFGVSHTSKQNMYIMNYIADYNGYGTLPNFSNMYQMTITHKDTEISSLRTFSPPKQPKIKNIINSSKMGTNNNSNKPINTIDDSYAPASTYTLDQAGLDLIKSFEGLRLKAYEDSVGIWTIGYGHTGPDVYDGLTITKQQAVDLLYQDTEWACNDVTEKVQVPITQNQFNAMVSLTYNLGSLGKTLTRTLNSGDYDSACDSFGLYVHAHKNGKAVILQGLVNRRAKEAAIFGGRQPPQGDVTYNPINKNLVFNSSPTNYSSSITKFRNNGTSEKTMYTLADVMAGLEYELKNQIYAPKSQLQDFMSSIRDDYKKKTEPNNQKKNDGVLPLVYNISLDVAYNNYMIDNRNLLFEQSDVSQNSSGINSFPIKPGTNIIHTIRNIMKLSSKIGQDAEHDPKEAFKTNIACIKNSSHQYEFNIGIKKYVVPKNTKNLDTGPGNYAVKPLIFTYQKDDKSIDIMGIHSLLQSDSALTVMEEVIKSTDNVIRGDREQITYERNSKDDFFSTSYSGVRSMVPNHSYFLEDPKSSANIDALYKTDLTQNSRISMMIIGNPNLLSDLFRNPIDVSNHSDGKCNHYKFPEFYPMYAKLDLYLKPSNTLGLIQDKDTDMQYYYKGYYHISKIISHIEGSFFKQRLELVRTDKNT